MYSLEELEKQNQEIADLCDVLSVLMEKKSLHHNPYVCELMSRFKEKVWMHLVFEDNTIYAGLLQHGDADVSEKAKIFHDSAKQIKRRFSGYFRHWCNPAVSDAEHEELLKESDELFKLVRERVQYENEYIFPLVS